MRYVVIITTVMMARVMRAGTVTPMMKLAMITHARKRARRIFRGEWKSLVRWFMGLLYMIRENGASILDDAYV